ncbi:MAG TPA: TetR/AcrR family transcriptional regulator [Acidimicrobiales bacterium]|jgi:AcrR family transcriptional regulator|nr:TetR/AcrR family transcriptional regulator [Acidimicrobiales bacterium]
MAAGARERILEATYACVARYGISKTTVEDAAREARLSRATVYRHFPGGKDELVNETIRWETNRFFLRLAEAVAGTNGLDEMLVEALLFAHRAIEQHAVLQKILQTEPELLLPQLSVDSDRVLGFIKTFLRPAVEEHGLPPGTDPDQAADYLSRMVMSFIAAQGRWDLTDREQVRDLVRTELLTGL